MTNVTSRFLLNILLQYCMNRYLRIIYLIKIFSKLVILNI